MGLEHKDRVSDISMTTGTGSFTVSGTAPAGYRTVAAAHTTGATVRYAAQSSDASQWEVGEGIWTSATSTLTRVTVFASSNANALVNFTNTPLSIETTMTAKDADTVTGILDKIYVYLGTAANTHSDSTWKKIALDTVSFDTNSLWNSANKRIIPKKPGYYQCNLRCRTAVSSAIVLGIALNGTTVFAVGDDTTAYALGGSGLIYCNGTTDYLELFIWSSTSKALTTGSFDTYFQAVGPL